jgi:riboflavin kinase/FMN adenylyltransferase
MKVENSFEKLPSSFDHSIIAIGNFDGVHTGHQKILQCLSKKAKELGLPSLILTFSPHPEKVLGKKRTRMIQTLEQRLKEIKKFEVQAVLVVPFDDKFSSLSSQEFIQKIVVEALKAKAVVIGENFRFGKNRRGDISLLKRLASKFNLQVYPIPQLTRQGRPVSSSLIRKLLEQGKIKRAKTLLGRPYEIEGKVIKGKSRGKAIGFPTANIETKNEIVPSGIFITTTEVDREKFPSLTNVGNCPTFGQQGTNIESYIINFDRNLYGKTIKISFIKKIREEIKFKTQDSLSEQIMKDLKTAKRYFKI